jgi:hypothetical protein
MSKLNKCAADGMYRMEGASVWVFADDADIWIIKGEQGLSISVWSKDTRRDFIDAINLNWKTIKGESK